MWNTENDFKKNILNVFEISNLHSQYKEDNQNEVDCSDSNYCFICYDQLDTVPKEQTKTCTTKKCDALYHMTCICEVNYFLFLDLSDKK